MDFDAVLLPARRARMLEQKRWYQRTINDALDACVAQQPDKRALTTLRVETGERQQFTYREMARMADRMAVGLSRLGVVAGDVVACQLPNWWQFTLTYLACSRIGAVLNPLMHIFRERELSFMLGHGEAKVFIVPKVFRGHDYEAMATALQPKLPLLRHIVVIDGQGDNSFDALLTTPEWENEPDAQSILTRSRPSPDDVTQPPERQQAKGEGQQVGGRYPLDLRRFGAQVLLQAGQRDVHDRHVDQVHEARKQQHEERHPAARIGVRLGLGHVEGVAHL